ncbi:uncharacterized protein [Ptychodera flava]|uniref:uncharacterized protein n=1 Tax=Ptychodera flava TaxID=63121 RepID=UPI00396A380A
MKTGISQGMLQGKPKLSTALPSFLDWVATLVQEVQEKLQRTIYPVMVAHNGYAYDYPLLFKEIHVRGMTDFIVARMKDCNLHFADSLKLCRELKSQNVLKTTSVSMESIFKVLFPRRRYNAHRSLEDTRALKMVLTSRRVKQHLQCIETKNVTETTNTWEKKYHHYNAVTALKLKFVENTPPHNSVIKISNYTYSKLVEKNLTYEKLQDLYARGQLFRISSIN